MAHAIAWYEHPSLRKKTPRETFASLIKEERIRSLAIATLTLKTMRLAGLVVSEKTARACVCASIIASDKTRHFRECPLRAKYPAPAKRKKQ